MDFQIEKTISNFIESQFPAFYQEEGPNFILFTKAYYEWMEQEGKPVREARNLFDYRDIDNTIEKFLEHFQKKYLYGIPFNVIINKRFLLKHILDVYRSKGSINCYKLLFKLIYNQEIDVYLPGRDMFKTSDGTWVQPRYLEVTQSELLPELVGKTIIGLSSNTTATVESYISEPINENIISLLYLSNIKPTGGAFVVGEKVLDISYTTSSIISPIVSNLSDIIAISPKVTGSLDTVNIINGGQQFKIGDVLKIAHRDVSNNKVISSGVDGLVRVTELKTQQGALYFDIENQGFGITSSANTFLYNNPLDTTGSGGSFAIGAISNTQVVTYNTDVICDYMDIQIDASQYDFPANSSANLTSNVSTALSFTNDVFGSLLSLTNINTGNGYTQTPDIFIRSVLTSNVLPGTISYNTTSNTVTGTNTQFTRYFSNNDCIFLQANSSNGQTIEYKIVKNIANNTSLTLYGAPNVNSTATAQFRASPTILPANFCFYDALMITPDNTINGLNSIVSGSPSSGNGIVGAVTAMNSGRGYVQGEPVKMYLYGGLTTPTIINGGVGYANNEKLVFSDLNQSAAEGFITTNGNGTIISATLSYSGSGYVVPPVITIQTANGSGAVLSTTVTEFNTFSSVSGRISKTGEGIGIGYWTTTRGFLNSDKYIQDSYFYQDFSYQIKVATQLNKYRDILYNTFHTAGSVLFGEYQVISKTSEIQTIGYEQTQASIS